MNSISLSRENSTRDLSEERPYNAARTSHNNIHLEDDLKQSKCKLSNKISPEIPEMNINSALVSIIITEDTVTIISISTFTYGWSDPITNIYIYIYIF